MAAEHALEHPARDTEERVTARSLTARQRDVLELIAAGYSRRDIAKRLGISHWTVTRHANAAYVRTGIHSRREAEQWAEKVPKRAQDERSHPSIGGGSMTMPKGGPEADLPRPLTSNEIETLRMISRGFTQSECATTLGVSMSTIHGYTQRLIRAYGAESITHAVAQAIRKGDLR